MLSISTKITGLINEITSDKAHGASELARQAVKVLKTAAEHSSTNSVEDFLLEQQEIGQRLISARPAMAPIFNTVSRQLSTITGKAAGLDLDSVRRLAITEADKLISDSLRAIARIARHGFRLIADGDSILTHSYSSTVVATLKEAAENHSDIEVIITRSGAGRTGERTANKLAPHGIPLTFIDDTAVGLYLATANKVMVGADRICADGGLINGIGTYQLALASQSANLPLYILCETLKFDPRLKSNEVDLEEKEPAEVADSAKLPPAVRIKNPNFDITPLELVTAMVTENGLLTPQEVRQYMESHG